MSDDLDVKNWVGVDLGGTKMLAASFDAEFNLRARRRKRTRGSKGQESVIKRMIELIDGLLEKSAIKRDQLSGIGVGCPSPIDMSTGTVVEAVNLGWKQVPLQQILQDEYECPVSVINDVDAGVFAESEFGAGKGAEGVLGIFPGTGIGGGCVFRGEILRGRQSCMEIGHIQVVPNGPLCGCGGYGCLETVASRLAISAAVAKAAYRGEAPYLLETAGTDLAELRSGVLAAAVREGDTSVEKIIRAAAAWIGIAVADCVHLLSPDVIVLGGGLVEAMPQLYVEEVTASANARVLSSFAGTFEIKVAELADDSTVRGVALWIARRMDPKTAKKNSNKVSDSNQGKS